MWICLALRIFSGPPTLHGFHNGRERSAAFGEVDDAGRIRVLVLLAPLLRDVFARLVRHGHSSENRGRVSEELDRACVCETEGGKRSVGTSGSTHKRKSCVGLRCTALVIACALARFHNIRVSPAILYGFVAK